MSGLAAKLPLTITPGGEAYGLLQNIESVATQNIKMIIFTNPGERVMDAAFGVGIRRFLFRQNTLETHDTLRNRIRQQINKYLPYVKIDRIFVDSVLSNPELPENYIKVLLRYQIPPNSKPLVLELPITA
tara:strand:- start:1200 stop:1589 length:390 start_codon:yes stop_codon:yes gene_type:complete